MSEKLRKSLTIFCCNFRFRAVQTCDNLVDLGKCCKMSIYLQNFMPIQPRTSLLKFGHLAAKSGKGTVLYLSTKASLGTSRRSGPRRTRTAKASLLWRSPPQAILSGLSCISFRMGSTTLDQGSKRKSTKMFSLFTIVISEVMARRRNL